MIAISKLMLTTFHTKNERGQWLRLFYLLYLYLSGTPATLLNFGPGRAASSLPCGRAAISSTGHQYMEEKDLLRFFKTDYI